MSARRNLKLFLVVACVVLIPLTIIAQDSRRSIAKGIKHYTQEEYEEALAEFLSGLENDPGRPEIKYDLGTAMFKLQDFEKAAEFFQSSTTQDNKTLASDAWYNLGNSFVKKGDLENAVGAYKNSLKLDHQDEDAKHNLEMALRLMRQQQQQQQESQESDSTGNEQQDQQQKQEQQDQEDNNNQEQQAQQQPEESQPDSTEMQQQPKPKDSEMSREEALQLLQALETDEQEAQKERLKRMFGEPKRVKRDW